MTNYFGFITLIVGLYCVWHLDRKIEQQSFIINDFVQREINDSRGSILPLDVFRIKPEYLDSITNLIFDLYQKIPESHPYSKEKREKLLKLLDYEKDSHENTPNIFLLNELLPKKVSENGSNIEKPDYALVIDDIKPIQNDSFEVSIIPVRCVRKDLLIEYYYNDERIANDLLSTFQGEISDLKARVFNPASCERSIIRGK